LHTVYLLVRETGKIQQLLLDTEKDKNPPIYIVFEILSVNKMTKVRHHIFHYIVNMLSSLYEEKNPRDTIGNCDKYFFEVAKRGHTQMFPSFVHTMMMFEYQIALSCCMYLKNVIGNSHAFLPKSYLAHIAFFDWAYGRERQLSTFAIIQDYKAERNYIARLQGGIWSFVKLFCGQRSQSFHMLYDVFAEGSPWVKTGEAERVFVFALVLLVNIHKAIPNTWKQARKSLEVMLMTDIVGIKLDAVSCPIRLREAVASTKKAKGLRDIAGILIKLLDARGDEELVDCTWLKVKSSRKHFCSDKFTKYGLINDTFYQFRPENQESDEKIPVPVEEPVEDDEADDPEKQQEEQVAAEYARRVLQQQEAHQLATEQDSSSTMLASKPNEATDIYLRIDDTMCNTCGVTFTGMPVPPPEVTESGEVSSHPIDDESSPSEELLNVGLDRQVSNESGPSSIDTSSIPEPGQTSRHDHESSEAHIKKQDECRAFLNYMREVVQPLLEASSVQSRGESLDSPTENEVRIQNHKLNVLIGVQQEKRDWSNIEPLSHNICEDLKAAIEDWKKGPLSTDQEVRNSYIDLLCLHNICHW
jgi:hypothetical protein